jgi:hypothetical protein
MIDGIGGAFLFSNDTKRLAAWYRDCLGVIGLGAKDTFISFNFQMVDNEAADMNGFTFLTGLAGSGINIGFLILLKPSAPVEVRPTTIQSPLVKPSNAAFLLTLETDRRQRLEFTHGVYSCSIGLQ